MNKIFIFTGVIAFFMSNAMEIKNDDIFKAIEQKNYKELKAIIAKNPQVVDAKNSSGKTPLQEAVFGNDIEAVRILLQAGAKPEGLLYATLKNNVEMVKLLLAYDVDISVRDRSARKRTALDIAKDNKNKEIIALLEDAARKKEMQQIVQKRIEEYTQKNKPFLESIKRK